MEQDRAPPHSFPFSTGDQYFKNGRLEDVAHLSTSHFSPTTTAPEFSDPMPENCVIRATQGVGYGQREQRDRQWHRRENSHRRWPDLDTSDRMVSLHAKNNRLRAPTRPRGLNWCTRRFLGTRLNSWSAPYRSVLWLSSGTLALSLAIYLNYFDIFALASTFLLLGFSLRKENSCGLRFLFPAVIRGEARLSTNVVA
ncbi:hypothetical protein Vadar_009087 [Vaccinium darrowii]|uniref:Uncharacterized protein n=1 Tax=Vaccinium darrowii TaxID=229202 RepID=A0ACB7XYJ5_9ERIC|nr:hypothetical protein Vadar_009087 [Vaccinium darrowii]